MAAAFFRSSADLVIVIADLARDWMWVMADENMWVAGCNSLEIVVKDWLEETRLRVNIVILSVACGGGLLVTLAYMGWGAWLVGWVGWEGGTCCYDSL